MKTSIVIDISPSITYPAKFWFLVYGSKCSWPIELQDSLKCNIWRKKWMMKFISCRGTSKFSTSWYYHLECAYADIPKVPKIRSLHNFAISPEKKWWMKWFFGLQIYTKVFYKMILSFWVCATRVTQSTQKNKFTISLQYLKENGKNEVYFLLVDKHQRFLQVNTIILGLRGQACPNYPK